jgi:hypothetical protein
MKIGAASRLTQQRQLEWQSNRSFEIKEAVFMPAANPEDSFCWLAVLKNNSHTTNDARQELVVANDNN